MRRNIGVLLAVGLLAGCGSSASPGTQSHDESEIVGALHLRSDDGLSYVYTGSDGLKCDIAVVLTSKQQVDLYTGAGDAVAKNPSGTAGVKIVTEETKRCLSVLTQALTVVP